MVTLWGKSYEGKNSAGARKLMGLRRLVVVMLADWHLLRKWGQGLGSNISSRIVEPITLKWVACSLHDRIECRRRTEKGTVGGGTSASP